MAKAAQVRKALMKDGWVCLHVRGSHYKLKKDGQTRIFSFHDGRDLGKSELERVAKTFGYDLATLRRLI